MHRRNFLKVGTHALLCGATAPLWSPLLSASALAQQATTSAYKAIVVVALSGGQDANNMLVPLASAEYQQYASLRSNIALSQGSLLPVTDSSTKKVYGFHPQLVNTANAFIQGNALVVANIGQMLAPYTKAELLANTQLIPGGAGNHATGSAQWDSAQIVNLPLTGWGGRMADYMSSLSGNLPPVLNAGPSSIFTVGNTVQGITVQNGTASTVVLPDDLSAAAYQLSVNDSSSKNLLTSQLAQLHAAASNQQLLISTAQAAGGSLQTVFPSSQFGQALQSIAQLLAGRSTIGASRQLFHTAQGLYDTHANQLSLHAGYLAEFDAGIGAFLAALEELNLSEQVLICTVSDFGRTMQSNSGGGSDHGWATNQLVFGGGIRGGRIIGSIPEPAIGGSNDIYGQGQWIPDLSISQMTAPIASWMGLTQAQVSTVFPDLVNFPLGPISLV